MLWQNVALYFGKLDGIHRIHTLHGLEKDFVWANSCLRFKKKMFIYIFWSNMAARPCDLWRYNYHYKCLQEAVHLWSKFRVNRTNNCRIFFCHTDQIVLHLSNYDVIMKALMTSSLTYGIPHGEYITMSHVSIFFPRSGFGDRVAKFFVFFQDGACTPWRVMS